jgi:acyl-CoA synthetase (AMP-forming)/AMP-acid ligase II
MEEVLMKKAFIVFLVVMLTMGLVYIASAQNFRIGENWFEINLSGPVTVNPGSFFDLTLKIVNDEEFPCHPCFHDFDSITAVILDPFTGIRVWGPQNYAESCGLTPGAWCKKVISLGPIPTGYEDRTLAVAITVNKNNAVVGTTGWAIIVNQ